MIERANHQSSPEQQRFNVSHGKEGREGLDSQNLLAMSSGGAAVTLPEPPEQQGLGWHIWGFGQILLPVLTVSEQTAELGQTALGAVWLEEVQTKCH